MLAYRLSLTVVSLIGVDRSSMILMMKDLPEPAPQIEHPPRNPSEEYSPRQGGVSDIATSQVTGPTGAQEVEVLNTPAADSGLSPLMNTTPPPRKKSPGPKVVDSIVQSNLDTCGDYRREGVLPHSW